MASKKRVVVLGARGVFGTHLVNALRDRYDVVEGTRTSFDYGGAFAVACTAGPFQQLDRRIVHDVANAGVHWLDISDDKRWFFDLLDDGELASVARERGVVVMPGLSTLPAISLALARRLLPAKRMEITLFIGNDNRKGAAAIASGSELNAPDVELLRREHDVQARVNTDFELPGARALMRMLGLFPLRARVPAARLLSRLSRFFRFGTSGGWVEVRSEDRLERISGGQDMAILPVVFALDRIDQLPRGVHPPTILNAEELLDFVQR